MKAPNVIYLQKPLSKWCKDKINDSDICYISEEAVIEMLREEYKQANQLIDNVSHLRTPTEGGLIDIDKSVRTALKRLKGGKQKIMRQIKVSF